jgi:hypothetical protein
MTTMTALVGNERSAGVLAGRESADRSTVEPVAVRRGRSRSTSTVLAPRTVMASDTPPTPRKIFIVARKNTDAYRQLMRTVGQEPGVEIIYDRRRGSRKLDAVGRLASRVKRALGLGRRRAGQGRRERPQVDQELKAKGWVVVRLDEPRRPRRRPASPSA